MNGKRQVICVEMTVDTMEVRVEISEAGCVQTGEGLRGSSRKNSERRLGRRHRREK